MINAMKHASGSEVVIRDLQFPTNEDEKQVYRIGKFAGFKDKGRKKIQFAMWFFQCTYHLKPNVIKYTEKKRILGFAYEEKERVEFEPQCLNKEQITAYKNYFHNKAIDLFHSRSKCSLGVKYVVICHLNVNIS
eukprot:UN04689